MTGPHLSSDTRLHRPVAIKEFSPSGAIRRGLSIQPAGGLGSAAYQDAKARFLDEARVLAKFTHPGIVNIYE